MPVTQSLFPPSTNAAAAVLALRAKQKTAFDKTLDEMMKLVGTRFTETLAKPKPGEIAHVPDEQRFEVTYDVPVDDLWRVASGVFNAAKNEFTDVSEENLRTMLRAALVQSTAAALKAQEYSHIDVKLGEKTESRPNATTRAPEPVVVHVLHIVASCPDHA
jgi:hypothetical protein